MSTRIKDKGLFIKSRAAAKGQITRLHNYIVVNNGIESMIAEELDVRLENLQRYWNQFNEAQNNLELLTETEDKENAEIELRGTVEDTNIETETPLKHKIRQQNKQVNNQQILHSLENMHSNNLPQTNLTFVP